jgi:hypothetical protein
LLDGLIAAAVAALVLAIAFDAVRGEDREGSPPSARAAPRADAVATLTSLGVRGTLVYTDRDCRFHALRLPSLAETRAPPAEAGDCSFELSPDGTRVAPAGAAWNASEEYAICNGATVELRTTMVADLPRRIFWGCVPAWRPGSPPTLTVADEGIKAVGASCHLKQPCGTVLIDHDTIQAAAANAIPPPSPSELERVLVHDVTWLSPTRVAVLLRIPMTCSVQQPCLAGRVHHYLLAIFEAGRLRWTWPFADSIRNEVVAGRRGQRLWAGGNPVFASDGSPLRIPDRFGRSRAAAWSPDEQWLALATGNTIAFVRPGVDQQVVTVPIHAADLAWR